jgi:hypothetical protein
MPRHEGDLRETLEDVALACPAHDAAGGIPQVHALFPPAGTVPASLRAAGRFRDKFKPG